MHHGWTLPLLMSRDDFETAHNGSSRSHLVIKQGPYKGLQRAAYRSFTAHARRKQTRPPLAKMFLKDVFKRVVLSVPPRTLSKSIVKGARKAGKITMGRAGQTTLKKTERGRMTWNEDDDISSEFSRTSVVRGLRPGDSGSSYWPA